MAQQKTVNGVPVTAAAFRRAIVDALNGMEDGAGSMPDLILALGPEWDTKEGRALVSKTLVNMAAGGKLKRDPERKGLYRVHGNVNRKGGGVSSYDATEQSIVEIIRDAGGFATWAEIMEVFDERPHGEERAELRALRKREFWKNYKPGDEKLTRFDPYNTWGYKQINNVLRTSERIRQDYPEIGGTGEWACKYYNLPLDQLNGLTLRGSVKALMIKATHEDLKREGSYFAERDVMFACVGHVFATAREARGLTLLDLASRKAVYAALLDLARDRTIDGNNRSIHRAETAKQVEAMRAAGATRDEVEGFRDQRRGAHKSVEAMADMLERFEVGGVGYGTNLHLRAPVSFYETLAAALGIDPVSASRGVLQIDTRGPRIRIERVQPTWETLGARDAKRDRELEYQQGRPRGVEDARLLDVVTKAQERRATEASEV
ncbi:MAG: hypothetical protein ACK4JY_03900 [Brevundimonas sp.]|uniref:hypothetical protein n=1 Tax=Brevundimonas sp. TaxID=1871086 RepID=UPI0039192CC6